MKKSALLLLCFCTLIIFSCSKEDDTQENSMEQGDGMEDGDPTDDDTATLEALVMTDVSYGSNSQQAYDIYLPAGRTSEKTKVLLLVHGGGWTGGDKSDMTEFVLLAQERFPDHAIVNMNYVLAGLPATPAFPNQYLDIQAVINQLTTQKDDLHILPEFGMVGASAGAHLSMMYDYVYDTTDMVKFVVNIVGPSDFTDPFYADDPNFSIALSLLVDESAYPAGTDYAQVNSPAKVTSTSSSPTLLFYGDMDPLVPLTNGQSLDNALTASGTTHTFTVYQGGHGDDWSDDDRLDLTLKMIDYVNSYLPIQ